jgi:uncharacterized protein (TIGR02217 family)
MHLSDYLPREIEIGAIRRLENKTEVVETDGGFEVRNNRWTRAKLVFELSFPTSTRDGTVYQDVIALFNLAEGGLHSFNFHDWTDESGGTVISVRFDSPLEIAGVATHIDHIETLTLREVFR